MSRKGEDRKLDYSNAGNIAKWVFIALSISAFIPGAGAISTPIGAIVIFAVMLLLHTGIKQHGGNDSKKPDGKPENRQ